jgi:hypothetical protein
MAFEFDQLVSFRSRFFVNLLSRCSTVFDEEPRIGNSERIDDKEQIGTGDRINDEEEIGTVSEWIAERGPGTSPNHI